MKKLVASFLITCFFSLFAENYINVFYKKNGIVKAEWQYDSIESLIHDLVWPAKVEDAIVKTEIISKNQNKSFTLIESNQNSYLVYDIFDDTDKGIRIFISWTAR